MTQDEALTWHHGLVARWWAEFNVALDEEVDYYAAAIRGYGEPALDLGCGTGRLLLPLLRRGLDVDGVDVSADMIALAAQATGAAGFAPRLAVQPLHALDLTRRYRTIFMCGVLGIGGDRANDREGLRRIHDHLEPGGALVLWHEFPYAGLDASSWARWLPGHRDDLPRPWPESGERRRTAGGDEIELIRRMAAFDPLAQRHTFEIRARLWRHDRLVREEAYTLHENLYFAPELHHLLVDAGFGDVRVEAAYQDRPATSEDDTVVFVARR